MTPKKAKGSKNEPARGAGRPTTYKPEYCETVIELGKKGYSRVEIAEALDVHRDTLQEWAKVHPEFSVASRRSEQAAQACLERMGRTALETPHQPFNTGLYTRTMSVRFPADWRESKDVNVGGQTDGVPVVFGAADLTKMTPEQRYAFLLAGQKL